MLKPEEIKQMQFFSEKELQIVPYGQIDLADLVSRATLDDLFEIIVTTPVTEVCVFLAWWLNDHAHETSNPTLAVALEKCARLQRSPHKAAYFQFTPAEVRELEAAEERMLYRILARS